MRNVFWLRPRVCGRSGPDMDAWNLDELARGGIGAILSVNDGELVDPEALAAAGIEHRCVPLSNSAPPEPGDREICIDALPKALAFADSAIRSGKILLVHCRAGKDRTGMFLSYYLCKTEGLSPAEAIEQVKGVRPIALSAPGIEPLTREVLEVLCD